MSNGRRLSAVCFSLCLLVQGCAFRVPPLRPGPGLPEEIIARPSSRYAPIPGSVCVGRFSEPSYASGVGVQASVFLHQELQKHRVFPRVSLDLGIDAASMPVSRPPRDCEAIITGEVLYFMEGSALAPSRVDERIDVIDIRSKPRKILWSAAVSEISESVADRDFIFFQIRGRSALPCGELLRRNAMKIVEMLQARPDRFPEDAAPADFHETAPLQR